MPITDDTNLKVYVEAVVDQVSLNNAKAQVEKAQKEIDAKWRKLMAGVATGLTLARTWFSTLTRAVRNLGRPLSKLEEFTFDLINIMFNFFVDTAIVLASTAVINPLAAMVSVALVGAATIWQATSSVQAFYGFEEGRRGLDAAANMLDTITRTLLTGVRYYG